ncbi:MAG: hypothetical protein IQL11_15345 [Bacteroidales bacterium]|nr:hypothetical protein [Bacteroidales bacterium]
MVIPNLLIIAGTGNKSGKTSMACRLIEQYRYLKVFGIKITPHFHETTAGLITIIEEPGYSVYEETNRELSKDSSRMLQAGALKVFFARVTDDALEEAFFEILEHIPSNAPIICESPALRYYVEPGLLIIMDSPLINKTKDISNLRKLPHVVFDLGKLTSPVPVFFENHRWICGI